jgi:uncharacterized protein YjiS (DUF1127 family)
MSPPDLHREVKARKDDIRPLTNEIVATLGAWLHPDTIVRSALRELLEESPKTVFDELKDLGYTPEDMDTIARKAKEGKAILLQLVKDEEITKNDETGVIILQFVCIGCHDFLTVPFT